MKLLIIGLDGVPYDLIKELSEEKIMPNFSEIIKKGTFLKMESSIPEVSSVAWASVITGKNPGEHGIYGFMDIRQGTYKFYFPNFNSLKEKPFWEEYKKLKSAIINVPGTYPARPLNGILISGFVALDLKKATYPKEIIPDLEKMNYRIDVDSSKGHKSKDLFIKDLFETLDARIKALFNLFDMDEWDIYMFVFTETDRLMHFLWDAYENEGHPHHEDFLRVFSKIDDAVGKFLDKVGDIPTIILSDHGFGRLDFNVNINLILREKGYLFFEKENPESLEDIKDNSLCFSLEPARIYLNYKGIYPKGCVEEEEKNRILDELLDIFSSLEYDGKKVIKKVFKKEEIYKGPFVDKAPDLVLVPNKGFNLRSNIKAKEIFSKGPFTGMHTQDDAFLMLYNLECLVEKVSVFNVKSFVDHVLTES